MVLERIRVKWVCGLGVLAAALAPWHMAQAEDAQADPFGGFYVGLAIASQNVWAGSLIDGVDVLTEDRRTVAEVSLGWRGRVFGDWFLGFEVQAGFLDGDLRRDEAPDGPSIDYTNDLQVGFGVSFGRIVGSSGRHILYAYAYETERDFDVMITDPRYGTFTQSDEQGFLRYGFALERAWTDRLRWKFAIGTYRVDFGDAQTNIDIGNDIEISIGLAYRLGSGGE
jgi:hypothetical protein